MKLVFKKALFPLVVMVILLLPLVKFDERDISGEENRLLARFPAIDKNFGQGFDKWVADRFYGRNALIGLFRRINGLNSHVANDRAFEGLNGWQFAQAEIKAQRPFKAQQLMIIKNNLIYLKKFCEERSISCYILIAPRKEDFVGLQNFSMPYQDRALPLVAQFDQLVPIIFPKKEMDEANLTDFVYFKTDHHWTEWGAFTAYKAVMTRIKADFPKLTSVSADDFETFYSPQVRAEVNRTFWQGHTCKLLNLPAERCLDKKTQYRYYQLKSPERIEIKKLKFNNQLAINSNAPNKERTVVIGNSFVENFMPFWSVSYTETKKIRTNDPQHDNFALSRWQEEITEFHPDIMVLVMNSFYSFQLGTLNK